MTLIFALGMIIGAFIGITLLSCCHLSKKADKSYRHDVTPLAAEKTSYSENVGQEIGVSKAPKDVVKEPTEEALVVQ